MSISLKSQISSKNLDRTIPAKFLEKFVPDRKKIFF
jgi:hypothetical protein